MTDFSKPLVSDAYATLLPGIKTAINDLARGLEPTLTGSHTNVPTGAIRWNAANLYWESYNGTAWGKLANTYAIDINGNAGSVPWTGVTGRPTAVSALTNDAGYGYTGFRNRVINGNMAISQRGTTFAVASGVYTFTLDRWAVYTGGAGVQVNQLANSFGYPYVMQVSGNTGNTVTQISHKFESKNCADLVGQSVTIQVDLQSSSAQTVKWELAYANAVDNFSTVTTMTSGTFACTSTFQSFVGRLGGLPAGVANGLALFIYPNNGGAFTSGDLKITQVQLASGTVATPFEFRPYSVELGLCQQYFELSNGDGSSAYYSAGGVASGYAEGRINFMVKKRGVPTIFIGSTTIGDGNVTWDSTGTNNAVIASAVTVPSTTRFNVTKSSGLAYIPYQVILKWSASAEL